MLPRERIQNAINFKPVDIIPLRIYPAAGGLYEHGQKLVEMVKELGHDFGSLDKLTLPEVPKQKDFDPEGSYHAFRTDEWGTTWEFRIFGIWGHPVRRPLDDIAKLNTYRPPSVKPMSTAELENAKKEAYEHMQKFYMLGAGGSIFESMRSIRREEDVLMDIQLGTDEINQMAEIFVNFNKQQVDQGMLLNVDGFAFGDDFGTQCSTFFSLPTWRKFFKLRYQSLFRPINKTGKKVFFHCCGKIDELFEEFKEIGVDVIWPQLPVYNLPELAKHCRSLGLALELHPDRGDLMQRGSPDEIRTYIYKLVDTFDVISGGSWLYLEVDPGFPWENVKTLFNIAMELRTKK